MNQEDNELLIQHIHPMEIRLKGVEKDVDHLDKSVDQLSQSVHELKESVDENTTIVNKIWNGMWGGGMAVALVWAIVKFVLPYIVIG